MNFISNLAEPISSITQIEIAVIIGLLIITLVAILVRRINIPYTVALVMAGLALALARSYQILDFQIPDQAAAGELIQVARVVVVDRRPQQAAEIANNMRRAILCAFLHCWCLSPTHLRHCRTRKIGEQTALNHGIVGDSL
jgi:hypothetical protein